MSSQSDEIDAKVALGHLTTAHLQQDFLQQYEYHLQFTLFNSLQMYISFLNDNLKPNLEIHNFVRPYWKIVHTRADNSTAPLLIDGLICLGISLQHKGAKQGFYSNSKNSADLDLKNCVTPNKLKKLLKLHDEIQSNSDFFTNIDQAFNQSFTEQNKQLRWLIFAAENTKWYLANKHYFEGLSYAILSHFFPKDLDILIGKYIQFLSLDEDPSKLLMDIKNRHKNRSRQCYTSIFKHPGTENFATRLSALENKISKTKYPKLSLDRSE
jgi:hypothetical protein